MSVFLGLFLVLEASAYVIWPSHADDEVFQKALMRHVLNSDVDFSGHENQHPVFGFQYTAHSEKEFSTPEHRYKVKTNAQGLRTKEFRVKRQDEFRVVLLGDSNFFGVGVSPDQTIEAELERMLVSRLDHPVSVYTLAVSGYNTVQEIQILRAYGTILKPDVIILGLFIGNDLLPNLIAHIDDTGNYSVSKKKQEWLQSEINDRMGWFGHSVFLRRLVKPAMAPRIRYALANEKTVLERTARLMQQVAAISRNLQAQLSIAILYPADGIAGGWSQWWTKSRKVGESLLTRCRDEGWRCVDQLAHMMGAEDREKYFFAKDRHPTAAGNARMGAILFEESISPMLSLVKPMQPGAKN